MSGESALAEDALFALAVKKLFLVIYFVPGAPQSEDVR